MARRNKKSNSLRQAAATHKRKALDHTPAENSTNHAVSPPDGGPVLSRKKRWMFRLAAAAGVPLVVLLLLEGVLRVGGYGYPTAFLVKEKRDGQAVFVQNDRFGYRFFGPRLARTPFPFSIPAEKQANTVRIFVFGESAAYGDPQPEFGLSRMLQAMLSLRHPDRRFEVVNAAMTGINSHAVLEIARDCTAAGGDIWVVYMGNNEVVGPFGAGTVFGTQTPPRFLIRANLALKRSRAGQLLDQALAGVARRAGPENWGGMEMFMENKVSVSDPRMRRVYENFRQNLRSILELARSRGISVVASTVAVNTRDCAPFASDNEPNLAADKLAAWKAHVDRAVALQSEGNSAQAADQYAQAASIDDASAELHFRWGEVLLAQNQIPEALAQFETARDLDLLRFRCDSKLNQIIRDDTQNR